MYFFSDRTWWWTVAGAAIVVAMVQLAEAQRGEGQRARGGQSGRSFSAVGFGAGSNVPTVWLLSIDKVQQVLNLAVEQKNKLAEVNRTLREESRAWFQPARGRFRRQIRSKMENLHREASLKVADILNEEQQKRLVGVSIQVNGASSLADPFVAAELNVTDEQEANLKGIHKMTKQVTSSLADDIRGRKPPTKEIQAKLRGLRGEARKKILAFLTTEQQRKLEALKSKPGGPRLLSLLNN